MRNRVAREGTAGGRAFAVALATLCIVLVSATAATAAQTLPRRPTAALSSLEQRVLADINAFRSRHHLRSLRLSSPLTRAARAHTQEMAAGGYFAHESANGSPFWKRIQQFYPSSSFRYWSVGENLLWAPHVDAQGALGLWLASPEHRANLLKPAWRQIGVAALRVPAAGGAFQGLGVTILTTDFGVRR